MTETKIPQFIKAPTPEKLELFMLETNISRGIWFKYFDIQFVKGFWYAWYFDEQSTETELRIFSRGE